MEYIRVTKENLEKEHICCAISNNKDIQVSSKKAWLADRFDEGLVFLKSVERGKCFIEYIPAECAWNPIEAPGYMYINCLWVSGSFKGHGYSSDLLSECIEDSKEKGKKGLCILAAARKKPFLADSKFLKYKGFKACDEADNGIQLWYLPFEEKTEPPVFKECAKHHHINESGYVLYYTNQCPFNAKYVPILEETAQKNGIPLKAVKIENRKDAQNVPTPITTYALFCDGEYPEDITYGKSDVCYELIRAMQLVGINVITRTEVEECFAIIDDEIVWHGGMNLLGKADVWDNLMRIRNSQVATELLEIALGCSEERRKSE